VPEDGTMKTQEEQMAKDSDTLIREMAELLDRWESANEDKSKYYIATTLIGALVPMLWGVCMFYDVSITEILSRIVTQQELEKRELAARMGDKDELH
jgi:hypothetical protein